MPSAFSSQVTLALGVCLYCLPSDVESFAHVAGKDTTAADNKKVKNKKPSSRKPAENGEKKDAKVRKKKVKKENPVDEAKNDSSITMETDKSALDDSVKPDVKKDSEAKKKAKKPKESKESKLWKVGKAIFTNIFTKFFYTVI